MQIKTLGVVGAGQMGSGICQYCAQKGVPVMLWEITKEGADKSVYKMASSMDKSIEKGKMSADEKSSALNLIATTGDLNDLADCDLVIEAVLENIDIKKQVFEKLSKICRKDALLASNTSGLSITQIAKAVDDPSRFIGMHFFGPVHAMKLIEIILGEKTSEKTYEIAKSFADYIDKIAVKVARDTAGFIVNRILFAYFMEAIKIYEEGIATIEDIDLAIKYGLNHPMGPFSLMDLGGLDTFPSVCENLKKELGDDRFSTPQSIKKLVEEGSYGRKNGRGWYKY